MPMSRPLGLEDCHVGHLMVSLAGRRFQTHLGNGRRKQRMLVGEGENSAPCHLRLVPPTWLPIIPPLYRLVVGVYIVSLFSVFSQSSRTFAYSPIGSGL